MDINTNLSALNEFFRLQISDQTNQAAAIAQAPALSDVQMRDLLQGLADFNTGFCKTESELGTTAVAIPNIQPASDMGSLSTADLLLLIRAESRKTTDLLIKNETADIKAQEASIDVKREETNQQLDKAQEAMKKAESWGKAMKIAGGVLMAVSIVATLATLGSLSPTIMVAAGLLAAFSTLPVQGDGSTVADLTADGLSEILQRLGMDEKAADRLAQGVILVLEIAAGIATGGAASTKVAKEVGTEVVEKTFKEIADQADDAAQKAIEKVAEDAAERADDATQKAIKKVAEDAAERADDATQKAIKQVADGAAEKADDAPQKVIERVANGAAEKAENAPQKIIGDVAEDLAENTDNATQTTVNKFEKRAAEAGFLLRMIEAVGGGAAAGGDMAASVYEYKAQIANADAKELKATIAYLQSLIESDADFAQMLMDINAKLDGGVAKVVKNEFQANENRSYQAFS